MKKIKRANMKEAVSKAVLSERRRREAKSLLRENIQIQLETKMAAEICLLEMNGLSSVWQGVKDAARNFGDRYGFQAQKVGQSDAERAHQEKTKKINDFIMKHVKKAQQARQKFNSQILKNKQIVEEYHEAVMQANAVYGQYVGALGSSGMEANRLVDELVNNLRNDLMSEIDAIKTMFANWNLGDVDDSLDKMHKQYKDEREEERSRSSAPIAPRSDRAFGDPTRNARKDVAAKKHRILRGKSDVAPDEPKKLPRVADVGGKFVPGDSYDRVKASDSAMKAKDKEIIKRMMAAKDPEERKRLAQMLVRHRKQMKDMGVNKKSKSKQKKRKSK